MNFENLNTSKKKLIKLTKKHTTTSLTPLSSLGGLDTDLPLDVDEILAFLAGGPDDKDLPLSDLLLVLVK